MGPLTDADAALRDRLRSVLGAVALIAEPFGPTPLGASATRGTGTAMAAAVDTVSLYLLEVAAQQAVQGGRTRAPLSVALRHLVTARGANGASSLPLLDLVLGTVFDLDGIEVHLDPLPAALFASFGIPVQPAFVIETTARFERAQTSAPIVTAPPIVRGTLVRPVVGRVVGPDGQWLGTASVALDGTGAWHTTQPDGSFCLAAAPDEHGHARVRVATKGREFVAVIDLSVDDGEILIHCDPREA